MESSASPKSTDEALETIELLSHPLSDLNADLGLFQAFGAPVVSDPASMLQAMAESM